MLLQIVSIPSLWFVPLIALGAILIALIYRMKIKTVKVVTENIRIIQADIKNSVKIFFNKQLRWLLVIIGSLAVLLAIIFAVSNSGIVWFFMIMAYLIGVGAAFLIFWLGIDTGLSANLHAVLEMKENPQKALRVAYMGGSVVGLSSWGITLAFVWFLYWVMGDPTLILGFSFGLASVALFVKVGASLLYKTADIAGEWVRNYEYLLPPEDPRNPMMIAFHAGQHLEDNAGMAMDCMNSVIICLLSAMTLSFSIYGSAIPYSLIDAQAFASFSPLLIAGGLIASLIGILIIPILHRKNASKSMEWGNYIVFGLFVVITLVFTFLLTMTAGITGSGAFINNDLSISIRLWGDWVAGVIGAIIGIFISFLAKYITNSTGTITKNVALISQRGHAENVLGGLFYGMVSIVAPLFGIVLLFAIVWWLDSLTGVACAAIGLVSISVFIASHGAAEPIISNAYYIAQTGHLENFDKSQTESLVVLADNNLVYTKNLTFGIGIFTLLVLFIVYQTFVQNLGLTVSFDLYSIKIILGALMGCIFPFLFCAILIRAIDKNIWNAVAESKKQFTEKPSILNTGAEPNYLNCVEIINTGNFQYLLLLMILTLGSPLLIGIFLGIPACGGFIGGTVLTGIPFSFFWAQSGRIWTTVKLSIETGKLEGKGTLAHAAALTGDSVGAPLKETVSSSLIALLNIMGLAALVFIGFFGIINGGQGLLFL